MFHVALPVVRHVRAFTNAWLLAAMLWCALGVCAVQVQAGELFTPPQPSGTANEILIVSTRAIGTACDGQRLCDNLQCQRFEFGDDGRPRWRTVDWKKALLSASPMPTVIYVHGNRIEPGEDRTRCMWVYRSLMAHGNLNQPIRFVTWSWPATTIPGPLKDMKVKAARTGPAGWQLAWFIDQLPEETPLSLIGYSYGARVASGALHVLGGGRLNGKRLTERLHPERPPIRVVMVAAAFDADWILPGKYHGQALSQMEQLVLVTNHRDPAMRLYHFSVDRGRIHALGKEGVANPRVLGDAAQRIRPVDMTQEVGRSHLLVDYLAAGGKMNVVWRNLVPDEQSASDAAETSLVGLASP